MRLKKRQGPVDRILEIDPWLRPYRSELERRSEVYRTKRKELLTEGQTLKDFANGAKYFGFHRTPEGWVYREWAPQAEALFLVGEFNSWNPKSHPLTPKENGEWVISLPGKDALQAGQRIKVLVRSRGRDLYRIPLYIHRVEQVVHDDGSIDWIGLITDPEASYPWSDQNYHHKRGQAPFIYEAHVGLAQEKAGIGSYREFADRILPRIKKAGYTYVQLMGIMQHPYYASFGYHVSNFFAATSWFGPPEDFKYLVNQAHRMGIGVLMDLVHSHAAKNMEEGINAFDGTQEQFFYPGDRGYHPLWDSMCFNYGKNQVLHFLLSNLKYWLEEYHLDGFRFDGVSSMLYWNHGDGMAFDSYEKYFSPNTNDDACCYLMLATELVHSVKRNALLIAEDMSGMPGLCLPIKDGGFGFAYRLAMGMPDLWIRYMKTDDHDWNMGELYHEFTTRRPREKKIAYAESHDQAIVGDKTLFFWLAEPDLYWHMNKEDDNWRIDRAMALHKMIRLLTISTGSDGYLNFIGNEFGHPEWIDFPRAENQWSYQFCRRQWHLADDEHLKYGQLQQFDRDMIALMKDHQLMGPQGLELLLLDQARMLLVYQNHDHLFLFNFHPQNSYEHLQIPLPRSGVFQTIFSTDRSLYGGFVRIDEAVSYESREIQNRDFSNGLYIYLPSRTALVLRCQSPSRKTR